MQERGLRSGVCPNCGSDRIYSGINAPMKQGTHDSNAIPITLWDSAPLDNYVCVDCGFVESYIGDRRLLEIIARKWPHVSEKTGSGDDSSASKPAE